MIFQINTYWNVETLYYVFNFVSGFMGSNVWNGIMKVVFMFSIAIGMFMYMGKKQLEFFGWFMQALIFSTLLNLPVATVILADKTNLEPPRTVQHIPLMMAVSAHTVNLISGALADAYETGMGIPSELGLAKGDVGFGHRILKNVNKAQISDPALRADLMQFFKECTLYDIQDGAISVAQMQNQTGVWAVVLNPANTNGARFVTKGLMSTTGAVTTTCKTAAPQLKTRIEAGMAKAKQEFGSKIFTRASTDAIALGMLNDAAGVAYSMLLGSSQSASDSMKQAMFNNMWKDAGVELPALMNDPTRIAEMAALQAAAGGARQQEISNRSMTILAEESIPNLRNWIEAILYALFPVAVIMTIVSSVEGARKVIGGYLMGLAWIGLWPLLFAIVNHLSMMNLQRKMAGLKLAAEGVTFSVTDVFNATLIDEQSSIAYLIISVPMIAGAIIKMGSGSIMGLADKFIPEQTAGAGQMAGGLASGNISMGNSSFDVANANSTSMNKISTSQEVDVGRSSRYLNNGTRVMTAASGASTYEAAMNRMPFSVREETNQSATRGETASKMESVSKGLQLVGANDKVIGLKTNQGLNTSLDNYSRTGMEATTADGGSLGKKASAMKVSGTNNTAGREGSLGMNQADTIQGGANASVGGHIALTTANRDKSAGGQSVGGQGGAAGNGQGNSNGSSASVNGGIGVKGGVTNTWGYTGATSKSGSVQNQGGKNNQAGSDYATNQASSLNTSQGTGLSYSSVETTGIATDQGVSSSISERRDVGASTVTAGGVTAGRNQGSQSSQGRDLMSDPATLKGIRDKNRWSEDEYWSKSFDEQQAAANRYAAERSFGKEVNKMPERMLDGSRVRNAEEVKAGYVPQANAMKGDKIDSMAAEEKTIMDVTRAVEKIERPAVKLDKGQVARSADAGVKKVEGEVIAESAKVAKQAEAMSTDKRRLAQEVTNLGNKDFKDGVKNKVDVAEQSLNAIGDWFKNKFGKDEPRKPGR